MRICQLAVFSILMLAAMVLGAAASPSPLQSSMAVTRISVAADGTEARQAATDAKPGDLLEYACTLTNASEKTLLKVMPVIPIPDGTALVAGSAVPAVAEASLDGATFAAMPLMRTVVHADGTRTEVEVPLSEYRALRWTIDRLAPKAQATVSLRVTVDK